MNGADARDIWIEIAHPYHGVLRTLAVAVAETKASLHGARIAVTTEDTLVFNHQAWRAFSDDVEALPHVITRQTDVKDIVVKKYLLIVKGD